jgi:hypothetical protein
VAFDVKNQAKTLPLFGATAEHFESPNFLKTKQPDIAFSRQAWDNAPPRCFPKTSLVSPNWLLTVMDWLYPWNGSLVALDATTQ